MWPCNTIVIPGTGVMALCGCDSASSVVSRMVQVHLLHRRVFTPVGGTGTLVAQACVYTCGWYRYTGCTGVCLHLWVVQVHWLHRRVFTPV